MLDMMRLVFERRARARRTSICPEDDAQVTFPREAIRERPWSYIALQQLITIHCG